MAASIAHDVWIPRHQSLSTTMVYLHPETAQIKMLTTGTCIDLESPAATKIDPLLINQISVRNSLGLEWLSECK
jgi:hypothetical protein